MCPLGPAARLAVRPSKRLFRLVLESHDGRALVPIPKRSTSPRATSGTTAAVDSQSESAFWTPNGRLEKGPASVLGNRRGQHQKSGISDCGSVNPRCLIASLWRTPPYFPLVRRALPASASSTIGKKQFPAKCSEADTSTPATRGPTAWDALAGRHHVGVNCKANTERQTYAQDHQ